MLEVKPATPVLHGFHSAYANQVFQPGCSDEMVQFYEHEAWVEDDKVAAEIDLLIKKGRIPHISRISVVELEEATARAKANLEALMFKAAAVGNAGANTGITTTTSIEATTAKTVNSK